MAKSKKTGNHPDNVSLSSSQAPGIAEHTLVIGGEICHRSLPHSILPADPGVLAEAEIAGLWEIFSAIGKVWKNTTGGSLGQKSAWLEFVNVRSTTRPSYCAEYRNALEVVRELQSLYQGEAFERLFQTSGVVPGDLSTAIAHAKHFVVDEFIRVQIVSGGFKLFVTPHVPKEQPDYVANHRAFIAGSRFNRIIPVRPYEESL